MTAVGWLAVGGAVLLAAPGGPAPGRVAGLAGAGRLMPSPRAGGRRAVWRVPPGVVGGVLATAAGAVAVGAGVALGIAAGAVAGVGWWAIRSLSSGRRAEAAQAELAVALETLIAELDAGGRPADALTAAAAAAPGHVETFARAAAEAAAGGDAGDVLHADPRTRGVGCAWGLGEQTGAALAGVLGRVVADLDAAARHRRAVAVALAGPRSSAAVLAGLPLLGIALGATMGADPLHFLLGTPAGAATCCVGVLLDVGGLLWMQWLLRRAAGP